ncbi:MAG TPA: hypothetical protein VKB46_15770 [Pyrinomonadaceae bacterium]|nr:hypothetical protein [Pyrinomonadaceae bacterium]
MAKRLQQLLIFAAPLLVGLVNLTHPMFGPPVYSGLIHHISWWLPLHLVNLVLFPLLGLAAYLFVKDVHNLASVVARVALAIFIPFYTAFDALAGIGTGILVRNAERLPTSDLTAVGPLIDSYWTSGTLNGVAALGSIAWTIAMLAAAVAFTQVERRRLMILLAIGFFIVDGWAQTHLFPTASNMSIPLSWWLILLGMAGATFLVAKPRIPTTLLVLCAVLFGASHVPPTGPLGMLCFLAAAAYIVVNREP